MSKRSRDFQITLNDLQQTRASARIVICQPGAVISPQEIERIVRAALHSQVNHVYLDHDALTEEEAEELHALIEAGNV